MRLRASLLIALLLLSLGCREANPVTPTPIVVLATPTRVAATPTPMSAAPQVILEGVTFAVELAVTPEERALGLMGRSSLGRNQGMLFVYEGDSTPGFWMRGMLIPLDMVWLDAEGVVAGVTANVSPPPEESQPPLYYPPRPIRYVLEISAGMAEEMGIGPESRATFLGIPQAAWS